MRANGQKDLLTDLKFDPVQAFRSGLDPKPQWDSIIEFATHRSFCGLRLYPRQITLLRLIYLETETMTAYDLDVIEQWREGFLNHDSPEGVQTDIWDRIQYLKERGYRHFPHIEAIIGRRGSKGKIGGVLGAEKMAYLYSLDDWQSHYGVSPGKDGFLSVVAVNSIQAKKFQFADIRETVENCKYLQSAIATSNGYEVALRTPADLRRIAYLHKNKIPIEHQIASLHATAMSSNSASGRGATGFANIYDEFAHMITNTGSQRSSEEIYEAYQPSLDQFGKDSLTYIPSSPFCLSPETPVLTDDLRWVPVGSLQVGDKLVGFDEDAPSRGVGRRWQQAEVTETSVIRAPRYTITMSSGRQITSTSEHRWLTSWASQKSRWDWRKTSELKPGDRIKSIGVDPWGTDNTREGGYLAGIFDGEGHLSGQVGRNMTLGFTQNRGPVRERVYDLLTERGYKVQDYTGESSRISKMRIGGSVGDVMRFLGSVRPERLLPKFGDMFYGSRIYGPASQAVETVVSVEYKDEGDVIALGTSTATLVADGLLSHNTQVGHFFSLYKEGKVLMSTFDKETGETRLEEKTARELGHSDGDAERKVVELAANPEMLVVQLPSWGLYEDWRKSPTLGGPLFKRPIQAYDERMMRLERSNPQKFNVERRSQFASVVDAFMDPRKVEAMFDPVPWREKLVPQDRGRVDRRYYVHIDPGLTNANFALAIAHLEYAPVDDYGDVWPHVIIDFLKVWKPGDYEDHTIDYVQVQREVAATLRKFPSTHIFSADQWNSAGMLAALREEFGASIQIKEETFTDIYNQERMDRMKSAINLGWVHSYRDNFYGDGDCLLELEMKFLQKKGKKVDKQEFGPVTTKDLFDAVNVVTDRMLKDDLDRWQAKMLGTVSTAIGSSNVAGIRSGRDLDRLNALKSGARRLQGPMTAREKLREQTRQRSTTHGIGVGGGTSRLRGIRG